MNDYFSAADPYLQDYKTKAEQATRLTSEATTLPDLLKKALDEKLANQPIIGERATAASNFLASLGQAPQTVTPQATGGIVLTPTEQASLISGRRALALQPLLAANQRYDLLSGTIADIISQASRAATAQAQQATGGAEIARNLYTDVMDRLYKQAVLSQKATAKTSAQQKQADALDSIDLALDRVRRVRENMVKGASGVAPGLQTLLQRFIGGSFQSTKTANLDSAISQLNKAVFETSGKAFTKTEAELLAGSIPAVKDDFPIIESRLQQMEADLNRRKMLISSGWSPEETTTSSTSNVIDYDALADKIFADL